MTQPWRENPILIGRFHPDAPDDVQVLVHDGGPRLTERAPEAVWVTIIGQDDGDIFTGRVLNQPQQLETVNQGMEIKFIAPSGDHLLMVTGKYLLERPQWKVQPCDKCGFDELFDAPSDLMRVVFPNIPEGATMDMMTAFCGICGGAQIVHNADMEFPDETPSRNESKRWWEFWK